MNITNALPNTQTLTQGVNTFTITPSALISVISILPTDNLQTQSFIINSIKIEKANSSVTVTSDDINQVVDYYPYGKVLREYVNGDQERYLTTQHERDQVTGLDYRGARYYDADVARFLSLDPLAAQFPNWSAYNYVMGNPVMLIDPDGRAPQDWVKNNGTGEYTWDENINSQEDFDNSDYNSDNFSYAGKEFQKAYSLGSTAGSYIQYYGPDGNTSVHEYPQWIDEGKKHIGLTEGGNEVIQGMIDQSNKDFGYADEESKPIDNDSHPWCGVFVYSCLKNTGQSVSRKPNSWQTPALNTFYKNNWKEGTVTSQPGIGAIAVMNYGHVAMVASYDANYVWILGGNQAKNGAAVRDGVEVNISRQRRSSVSAYVLPEGYSPPPLGAMSW